VVAANWTDPVGSIATIDMSNPSEADTALVTTDGTDVYVTSFGGLIYVLNRFGADTVQVIDPSDFSVVANFSVGAGSNPQDIFVRSSEKAYITRLDSQNDPDNQDDILIVNPLTGEFISSIDLKPYTSDQGDGLARAAQMARVGDRLFVLIQDLPANLLESANVPGRVLVLDMIDDSVIETIVLEGRNPSDIAYSSVSDKLYISDTGVFNNFVADPSDPYGGIEAVNPDTMQTEGIVIDDADFGGYVFQVRLSEDRAYTIVEGYKLASFDLESYEVLSESLYESAGFFLPDIAVDSQGRVLVTERDPVASGIVVLDGESGEELFGPVEVGALPAAITFVDVP
jgi:DNA-binding beta-propeller fold protein YncE